MASSMSLADPDRSRIAPMKMNMGIEASTGSAATPAHMRSTMSEMPMRLKTPSIGAGQREDQRQAAHDEGHGIAHEDEEEHAREHDEREVVGQPVEHDGLPFAGLDVRLDMADLQVDFLVRLSAEQEDDDPQQHAQDAEHHEPEAEGKDALDDPAVRQADGAVRLLADRVGAGDEVEAEVGDQRDIGQRQQQAADQLDPGAGAIGLALR